MPEQRAELVVIVGGGVIGLSTAWRLATAGYRVTVVDSASGAQPTAAASWVAGGMLAPIAEAWPGEEALLELGAESLRRWPDFAEAVSSASGRPSGLRTEGTLVVGVDSADRADLDRLADYLSSLGWRVNRCSSRELRRLEPSLGPAVRGGLDVPGDLAVDNRIALGTLRSAAESAGATFAADRVRNVRPGAVELESGTVDCDAVVIAAGAWSGELHPGLQGRIRPVKGEILRLRRRGTALPPPGRTIRGPVHGRQIYLVPREDGIVVGATQYEAGFDTEVTVGGVRDLIADAEQMMPGISEYALAEAIAGLRPSTEDNLPVLGWLEPGVLAATGHYRGGFLLAPLTADAVLAMLRGDAPPPEIKAADPARWEGRP